MGREQDCVAFKNSASGNCLGKGHGLCDSDCNALPMFRTKGEVLANGNIANYGSDRCMIPVENSNEAQVTTIVCDDDDVNQQFSIYENGEIVHNVSGLCLGDAVET